MYYSSSRNGVTPSIVVIHTGEGILKKEDMAAYFDNRQDASCHAASDSGGVVGPLVAYDRAAWTAGGTANTKGLHIEMCSFAALNREQWLSREDTTVWIPWLNANRVIKSPYAMMQHTANWTREVAHKYGIPLVKVSSSEIRNGAKGICGHADTSAAWRESDHTDPGVGFPWDVFINMVNGAVGEEGVFMALSDWEQERLYARILSMSAGVAGENYDGVQFTAEQKKVDSINVAVADIRNAVAENYKRNGEAIGTTVDRIATQLGLAVAQIDGLVKAVSALSNDSDLTREEISRIITEAVQENLKIEGTFTVRGE